jgi:hypothetical protein
MIEIIAILLGGSSIVTTVITIVVQSKKDKTHELKERFEYWEKKFDEYGCLKKSCNERIV